MRAADARRAPAPRPGEVPARTAGTSSEAAPDGSGAGSPHRPREHPRVARRPAGSVAVVVDAASQAARERERAAPPGQLVAAVVGRPDDVTGEAVCAFVVLKRSRPVGEEARQIANELRAWVAKEIGPIAKPKDIRFGDNLPKTRSGKIMRRLLRSIAKGEAITQDTSTLENPAILEQLAEKL